MKKASIVSFIVLLLHIVSASSLLHALPLSHFASSSKLAEGRWAKIRVSETGVHQITANELSSLGFNDISKVKIFGAGGKVLKETLNSSQPDDLTQIPVYLHHDKLIFYAQGPTRMSVSHLISTPIHQGEVNPYSLHGYYFITDSDKYDHLSVSECNVDISAATASVNTSYDYVYHNNELISLLNSGKTFYGEDLTAPYNLSFALPYRIDKSPVALSFSVGASVSTTCIVEAFINDKSVNLHANSLSRLGSNKYFEISSPYGSIADLADSEKYSLNINIKSSSISFARLDYYSVTYLKNNVLHRDSTQMRMAFDSPSATAKVNVNHGASSLIVWDVTSGTPRNQQHLSPEQGDAFVLSGTDSWEEYIAFNPDKRLKMVRIEGLIPNQNLHALSTPDFVIIHPANFKEQANLLAEIHHIYDNYDVLTIDEDLIFNEFSSGTPDATAYRLFLKMLYDRNPKKLKYLLLLGCGSYDNRGINGFKSDSQLLTYQSIDSNGLVSSYVTDDYFGFLADGSGSSPASDALTICVGRIPAKDSDDANAAINNLVHYITNQDYEDWRSNALVLSDKGDKDLHTTQAEGLVSIIRDATGENDLNIEKIYQEWYITPEIITDNISNGAENKGRIRLDNLLKQGVLYVSYIGHAGQSVITHDNRLWTSERIRTTKYNHLPFFAIAACETAKFDDTGRSFCEELVMADGGGAIGVLAAARTVYSSQNDMLNKALAKCLFALNENGSYRTIGEACKEAKNSFGSSTNYNKLSFTLFGDPAVRFRYPVSRCNITHINNLATDNSAVMVSPLSTITVTGVVNTLDGDIDTNFNGTATISLFDKALYYKELISPSTRDTCRTYIPREKLSHSSGEVKNGKFSITLRVPANCRANGDSCVVSVFAQSTDKEIVSGSVNNLIINKNNIVINDSKAPVIESVTIDGLNAESHPSVSPDPTIQFTISDNLGIDTRPGGMQGAMKLSLDNGKVNINSLSNYTRAYNDGRLVEACLTMHNLAVGRHTLRLEASDYTGHSAVNEYVFYVNEQTLEATLNSSCKSTRTEVELSLDCEHIINSLTIFIYDYAGRIVRSKKCDQGTWVWNLTDNNGMRVKPGMYKIYAQFSGPDGNGTTESLKTIILD